MLHHAAVAIKHLPQPMVLGGQCKTRTPGSWDIGADWDYYPFGYRLSWEGMKWEPLPPMSQGRSSMAAAALDAPPPILMCAC